MSIAILGFGNIGGETFELIKQNSELVSKALKFSGADDGDGSVVSYIMTRNQIDKNIISDTKWTDSLDDILHDPSVKLVAESIGGTDLAFEYCKKIITSGRHLISANKDLIASRALELASLAEKHNVKFLFEASCCGGIPIIKILKDRARFAKINSFCGIVNGTSNYILSQMHSGGLDFIQALKQAQSLGYAESNPKSDVEGYDAAYKATIMSSICLGRLVNFAEVSFKGIKDITLQDINYAKSINAKIKLVAIMQNTEGRKPFISVLPCMVQNTHKLYFIDNAINGVEFDAGEQGRFFFSGPGAGGKQTAASMFNDIMDALLGSSQNHFGFSINGEATKTPSSLQNLSTDLSFDAIIPTSQGYTEEANFNPLSTDLQNTKFFIKLK